MIKLRNIIRHLIFERLSFGTLLRQSDPERKKRANHVDARNLLVTSGDTGMEKWIFSYKSQGNHSTTGMRHRGYIQFFKDNVAQNEDPMSLDCIVDCNCPDFKYKYAYNNNKAGATPIGSTALNTNNGQKPQPQNDLRVPGLCKHLISLSEFLNT